MANMDWRSPTPERLFFERNAIFWGKIARKYFPFVFALLYASFLASLPLEEFKDRLNYLEYAQHSILIFASQASGGLVALLANEPLWLALNIGLAQFLGSEAVLRTIIFIPAFLVPFLFLRANPSHLWWLLFFLLIPQVIKNHIIHLRQGAGLAVFLLGYYSKNPWVRLPLMGLSGFVHSSFFVVNFIGVFSWASGSARLSPALRIGILLVALATVGLLLNVLAAGLGARQGDQYAEAGLDVSGLGFLVWSAIFFIFASSRKEYLIAHIFPFSILAFYLLVYFVSPVSGRIFESGIMFVFLAGLSLSGWRRQAFLGIIIAYTLLSYMMRLGQPGLGWA